MIYSLSEIDATCKKAARGAGLSWGYAEEAAKAVRWLAAHQLPSTALLAVYLTERQRNTKLHQGVNRQCPLLTGATLCDAGHDELTKSFEIQQVVYPLLLLPYLVQLSQAAGLGLRVQWSGACISCIDAAIYIQEHGLIATAEPTDVICTWLGSDSEVDGSRLQEKGVVGQFVEAAHWSSLESLAQLTYVPATEESRRGAGPAD